MLVYVLRKFTILQIYCTCNKSFFSNCPILWRCMIDFIEYKVIDTLSSHQRGDSPTSHRISEKSCILSSMNLMCAVLALNRLNIHVTVKEMNDSIAKCEEGRPGRENGLVNVGKISECVFSNLVKVHSRCYLRRLRLGTSYIGTVNDFIREYTECMLSKKITRETKIILIGWAGKNHFELDKGITHYTCVWNGVFMDGEESTFPISVDNISNAYYGLELTRLKVYYLQDFQVKKNRKTKKASTTSSS